MDLEFCVFFAGKMIVGIVDPAGKFLRIVGLARGGGVGGLRGELAGGGGRPRYFFWRIISGLSVMMPLAPRAAQAASMPMSLTV